MEEKLRPYQTQARKDIFDAWRKGHRSILFQMPTGTGKTILFSEIVRMGFEQGRKILTVVHRKELVDQITDKLHNRGVEVGHIIAGKKPDYQRTVQVASIQTLSRRKHPEADLIIIDECHHAKAKTYAKLWEIYPDAKFLGVTATPWRLSGEGFDDLFDALICAMPVHEFVDQGHLVPVTHYASSIPDLSGVRISRGEYKPDMLSQVMLDNAVMADLIESYKEHCAGKSTIVFAVNVEHSLEITERFRLEGIKAAHVGAKTPKEERAQILRDFRNKKIQVVSNVGIITEGFDFPECEAVQLARPTKSLALYLQMTGRVMRPAEGKTEGIVLDNAGLWREHGLSQVDRVWKLESTKRKRTKYKEIEVLAEDEDGVVKQVSRFRLDEIKGLRLIPITDELERLIHFETYVSLALQSGHKMSWAYYSYKERYVEYNGWVFTKTELDYIKKRVSRLDESREEKLRVNRGFWYYEAKKIEEKKLSDGPEQNVKVDNEEMARRKTVYKSIYSKPVEKVLRQIERPKSQSESLETKVKVILKKKVTIDSLVTIRNVLDDNEMTVRFTDDKSKENLRPIRAKTLHIGSPLASSLLGKEEGEHFKVDGLQLHYEVVEITLE